MLSKRRVRFSIGAMLVVMALVAVLLNREVQRAKAIEITVKRIEERSGKAKFRCRANMPAFFGSVLPQYWTVDIDDIKVNTYSSEFPRPPYNGITMFAPDHGEFEKVLELGTLDHLSGATLYGTRINYAVISRVCKSPAMQSCHITDAMISDEEIEELKRTYPNCKFKIVPYRGVSK